MTNNLWPYLSPYAVPAESQLNEPGGADRFYNCVYSCTCVVLAVYGHECEPEDLRNMIHPGAHHSGGESFDVVRAFLSSAIGQARFPGLPRIDTWNPTDTLGTFAQMLDKGYPTIFDVYDDRNANVLSGPLAGWGGTHAVLLEAMGPTKLTLWNPWNGEQSGQTYTRAYAQAATRGTYVGNLMVFARSIIPAAPKPVPPVVVAPKPVVVPPIVVAPPPVVTPPVVTPPVVVPPVVVVAPVPSPIPLPPPVPIIVLPPPPIVPVQPPKPPVIPVGVSPLPAAHPPVTDTRPWFVQLIDTILHLLGKR